MNIPPPEIVRTTSTRVACDGSGAVPAALGHPRVFLHIEDELGYVECGYCDRRFVLEGGPADIDNNMAGGTADGATTSTDIAQ
jgi:NADH dehydrogenase (ubiquinone) Fe-S protein 6